MKQILIIIWKRMIRMLGFSSYYEVQPMNELVYNPDTGLYSYPIRIHNKVYRCFYLITIKRKVEL